MATRPSASSRLRSWPAIRAGFDLRRSMSSPGDTLLVVWRTTMCTSSWAPTSRSRLSEVPCGRRPSSLALGCLLLLACSSTKPSRCATHEGGGMWYTRPVSIDSARTLFRAKILILQSDSTAVSLNSSPISSIGSLLLLTRPIAPLHRLCPLWNLHRLIVT